MPTKEIEPFLSKLGRLKVIKRGFEVIDADTTESSTESLSREIKRNKRNEKKKQREQRKSSQ